MINLDWVITVDTNDLLPMINTREYMLEEGSIVKAKWNARTESPYPWPFDKTALLLVLKNYDAWILCRVLPHDECMAPYRVTLTKSDIFNNIVSIWVKDEGGVWKHEKVWPEQYNYCEETMEAEEPWAIFG